MYCNFILVNQEFLDKFSPNVATIIKDNVYFKYRQCGKKKSNKLASDQYFSSTHIKYKFVYTYCPKCKKNGFLLVPFRKASLEELKYCALCGESNISYRYLKGYQKAENLLMVSKLLFEMGKMKAYHDINQQLIVLLSSIMEAYLRDFYAGLLNSKFVNEGNSLFEKFASECNNDFQSPSKANNRLKRDLGINFKNEIGNCMYKILDKLSAYRNVIVHNSGICDQQFINRRVGAYSLHDNINLSIDDIRTFITTLNDVTQLLDKMYQEIIGQQIISNLEYKVLIRAPSTFAIFVPPGAKIINSCGKKGYMIYIKN